MGCDSPGDMQAEFDDPFQQLESLANTSGCSSNGPAKWNMTKLNAHFPEQVAIHRCLEFFQNEEDALFDEELLVMVETLIELLEVALANRINQQRELLEVVFLRNVRQRHQCQQSTDLEQPQLRELAQKQLHRHQELEDSPKLQRRKTYGITKDLRASHVLLVAFRVLVAVEKGVIESLLSLSTESLGQLNERTAFKDTFSYCSSKSISRP